ncbi:hypothetical protein Barb4_03407 [Bacteroidales bacterium Barb4]|nr:hypothetical protein Barb4_03407 [Bacteroidales bacterium Barb4]
MNIQMFFPAEDAEAQRKMRFIWGRASMYAIEAAFAGHTWHQAHAVVWSSRRDGRFQPDVNGKQNVEECGITDNAVRKVLKERYKMQPTIFGRSFRTPLGRPFCKPHISLRCMWG